MALYIALGVLVLLVLFAVGIYNGLVRGRNDTKNSWSQIDVQLKRRHDLIPNLVETAKGYIKHERETLEAVIKARQVAVDARSVGEAARAENALTGTLRSLFAVAENYPQLKANENMLKLQEELTSTENRIGFARQAYNDEVLAFNDAATQFPGKVVAGFFGMQPATMLQSTQSAEERQAPRVAF
jgi:LemA protein